nr:ribonuclease H-like domain-containing protein [Tanacetum cinerariifolium]
CVVSESVTSVPAVATNEAKTSESKPKSFIEPHIEDWISDSEDENETESKSKQRKPSFAKYTCKQNKGQLNGQRVVRPVWNNTRKANSSRAVVLVNTSKPVNTAYSRPTMNSARTMSNVFNRAHSHDRRPFNKFTANKDNNFNKKFNTVRGNITTAGPRAVVSDDKRNQGNPQLELQEKGIIDSGCSRHMTGNMYYLSEYEEIDGGYVAFGGDPKGGKITGKGKISRGKLDFEDVYFVKELKFNLFSVSQMCD